MFMQTDFPASLLRRAARLPEPPSLFEGERLPEGFRLPDNILVFYHDFPSPMPNSHRRCTLVLAFDPITYFIEQQTYRLAPGQILFVPPHALRFMHPASAGYRRLFITCDDPGPQPWLPAAGAYTPSPAVQRLLRALLAARRQPELSWCLLRLFAAMGAPQRPQTPPEHSLPAAVARAVAAIEGELPAIGGLADVARRAGLSPSRLRTLFKRHVGASPSAFLTRRRLENAQYRLRHTADSIGEVARSCGFATIYVFSAFFKRHIGLSPIAFRKSHADAGRPAP